MNSTPHETGENPMPMTIEAMQAAVDNPETGSIRRRALRRMLAGIKAVGATVLRPAPAPAPTRADELQQARRDKRLADEHRATIENEIAVLDRHAADVSRRIENLESTSAAGATSYALQEWRAESRLLRELRAMLVDDIAAGPVRNYRDGRPVDDRDRAILRLRAKELRDSGWAAANRADAEGDRRRARQQRIDALRARQIAEHESGLRPFLAGYSQPWM
jgi:hypothetical protein